MHDFGWRKKNIELEIICFFILIIDDFIIFHIFLL